MNTYRVWPDGTVQAVDDGEPYNWMSDNFQLVIAESGEDAVLIAAARPAPELLDEEAGVAVSHPLGHLADTTGILDGDATQCATCVCQRAHVFHPCGSLRASSIVETLALRQATS